MPMSPRWIVPDMLLMPTFQISDPVEAFIQMVIHDLARRTLHLSVHMTCAHSTLIPLADVEFPTWTMAKSRTENENAKAE
jgi:hypothetical protein